MKLSCFLKVTLEMKVSNENKAGRNSWAKVKLLQELPMSTKYINSFPLIRAGPSAKRDLRFQLVLAGAVVTAGGDAQHSFNSQW